MCAEETPIRYDHTRRQLLTLAGCGAIAEPDATGLRQHMLASHTTTEEVGRVATEAGVKALVLSPAFRLRN